MEYHGKGTPLIFLDVDGVMTSCSELPGSYLTHSNDGYGPSESCVERLRSLLDRTGAVVVIASNWRNFDDEGPAGKWRHPFLGTYDNPLPRLRTALGCENAQTLPKTRHTKKAVALRMWFAENAINPTKTKYVIFDDSDGEGYAESEFREHFIRTDPATGLTDEDCAKAERVLK